MSWNRTVTCSWCFETGHNKAGCPQLKEYISKNPDSWQASQAKQKKARKRKCSYCEQSGHNRKTCALLRGNREIASKRNKEFRAAMLEHLKNLGIGIGALAEWKANRWDDNGERARGMVNHISWDKINVWDASDSYYGLRLVSCITFEKMAKYGFAAGAESWEPIPTSPDGFGEPTLCGEYGKGMPDANWLMSPLSPEDVEKGVPAGWLDGADGALDEHFDKSRKYWQHQWVLR